MLRAVIIDDEQAGIQTLQMYISRLAPDIKVVGCTTIAEQGIGLIEDFQPDLVFLDVSMPGMNGFQLLEKIVPRNFELVFTTAHEEYALKALKAEALDYLLKPITEDDFLQFVRRLKTIEKQGVSQPTSRPSMLELQVKDGIIYLKQPDIIRLQASGNYSEFFMENGIRHLVSKSLKEYEAQLDHTIFFRCHHSHIINIHKVERFINHEGFFAKMNDGSLVDISRKNKDLFLARLKNLT